MRHVTMQLSVDPAREAWDVHVTVRDGDDRDAPPRRVTHYRDITLASVERFYHLSGGYRADVDFEEPPGEDFCRRPWQW